MRGTGTAQPSERSTGSGAVGDGAGPVVEGRELHVSFGELPALRGASIRISAGEAVAVIGPSGSGKSTLLHCLAALISPSGGSVLVDGVDLASRTSDELAELRLRRFGFVFQFGHLLPELSAIDNVALPLRLRGQRRRDARRAAHAMLETLGVDALGARHPSSLSGGQLQRVVVARALIGRPAVVFADEPTGALDSVNAELVLQTLVEGCAQADAAAVVVSHDPAVMNHVDRVIELRDGSVSS